MKKYILTALTALILSFSSHAVLFTCTHDETTGNSHFQSWTTHYHHGDVDSATNAVNACTNNGGRVSAQMELSDLFAFFY